MEWQRETWNAGADGGPPGGFDGRFSGGGYGAPPPPPPPPPPGAPPPPFGGPPGPPFGAPPPPFGYGPVPGAPGYGAPTQVHQLATASLACATASLPMSCCCGLLSVPLAVAGIVCGIVGLSRIKAEPQLYEGTNHCIAGIVIGGLGLLAFVAMFALGFGMQFLKALGKL